MEFDFKMYPSGEAGSTAKEVHVHFDAFIHSNAVKLQSNEKEKGTSMLSKPSLPLYRKNDFIWSVEKIVVFLIIII